MVEPPSCLAHLYAPPAIGICEDSSAYTVATSSCITTQSAIAGNQPPPATTVWTQLIAYTTATGETVANPMVRLFQRLRLRLSVSGGLVAEAGIIVSGRSFMTMTDLSGMAAGLT